MLRSFGASLSFEEPGEMDDWEDGGDSAYVERVLEREMKMKREEKLSGMVDREEEEDVGDGCCIKTREMESDCLWRIHGGV
jgi:hypothetical protein